MINLIPPKGRRAVTMEYWAHVITVWSILFCAAVLIGGVLLVPSFVLLRSELSAVSLESGALKAARANTADLEETVKETNTLAGLLAQEEVGTTTLSAIVSSIDIDTPRGISLDAYTVKREGVVIQTVQVSGVADSRETLTTFRDTLEKDPLFDHADIPISDLVRGIDLPFTITISMASAS